MRPPAIEKLGYYPTDAEANQNQPITNAIMSYILPAPKRSTALDPCCGKGLALETAARCANAESYGVELSISRYRDAVTRVKHVINTPWGSEFLTMTDESMGLLWLNPPYEYNHDTKKRFEEEFLDTAFAKLVRGGVLVYIVPVHILRLPKVQRILCGYFDKLTIRRFPQPEYSVFKQIIVMGKRVQSYHVPAKEEMEILAHLANAPEEITELEPTNAPIFQVPDVEKTINFRRKDFDEEEEQAICAREGVHSTDLLHDLILPDDTNLNIRPVMPLRKGHIAMLLSAGVMGVLHLKNTDGKPMLVKGQAFKIKVQTSHDTVVKESGEREEVNKFKDVWKTSITTVIQDGEMINHIRDTEPLQKFMDKYAEQLALLLQKKLKPLYNFDPTPEETAHVRTLGLNRPALPGVKPGFLPTQEAVIIATTRALKHTGSALLQGQMGVGKSGMAAATLDMISAYPAILMCPPHLIEKWKRELEWIIPGVHVREVRVIGESAKGDTRVRTNDLEAFRQDYEEGRIPRKAVALVANSTVWLESPWKPAVITKRYFTRDGKMHTGCACPKCGNLVMIKEKEEYYIPPSEKDMPARPFTCQAEVHGHMRDKQGKLMYRDGNPVWGEVKCGNILYTRDTENKRRYSLSTYILKHMKNFFKMFIADESHQFKSKDADRAFAYHHIARSVKYTLSLTGTIFGGRSTSIFWLLHRTRHDVRADFGYDDENRWVKMYGVEETTIRGSSADDDDYGRTGNRRYKNTAVEKPGVSPAVAARILDHTVFFSIKDMGYQMPAYKEEMAVIDMDPDQGDDYRHAYNTLRDAAIKNRRLLSTYLQTSLARPNSCFRDETVEVNEIPDKKKFGTKWGNEGKVVKKRLLMELPAVIRSGKEGALVYDGGTPLLLPKEQWLVNRLKAESRAGRKTLVYMRQTGTRDIQERILDILRKHNIRAGILRSGGSTRTREALVTQKSATLDVLIVNPKLVETGLDLVQFANVIYFEPEYSLYTLWQSIARVHRPGQRLPVNVIFSVYRGAMEETALKLMGQKMKAAQQLYGDDVAGALVPDDDDDLLSMLAKALKDSDKIMDLSGIFATAQEFSHAPTGDLMVPSAPILTEEKTPVVVKSWQEWALTKNIADTLKSGKKKQSDLPGQASLF